MEETQRQKKIGALLQKDLVDILQNSATQGGMKGVIISVSKVTVTTDLSIAKAYLSIFPKDKTNELLEGVRDNVVSIRHELARRTK
ncbi:MAG: ribosome-binding factor A, partial [Mangrovimonas sp.]|nr:ribosome-binding factor A [Mangrovimonas sp.]